MNFRVFEVCLMFWAFAGIYSLNGQSKFAVSHLGNTSIYDNWTSAITNSVSGDTVYLPGGSFNIASTQIAKQLTIFGAGYFPDSTQATFPTILYGNLQLVDGADSSVIMGIHVTGVISFGYDLASSQVTNVKLIRNRFSEIYLGWASGIASAVTNVQVIENLFTNLHGGNAQYVYIKSNLIQGFTNDFNNNVLLENNTYLGGTNCIMVSAVYNATFRNNVFMISDYGYCYGGSGIAGAYSCIFEYNVFRTDYPWSSTTNVNVNNYMNVPFLNFFVNETNYVVEYENDYHLQSPATHVGTDGTQVGIFGSSSPFKIGGVPVNPHIQSRTIAPSTNNLGQLNVNIKVRAQSN